MTKLGIPGLLVTASLLLTSTSFVYAQDATPTTTAEPTVSVTSDQPIPTKGALRDRIQEKQQEREARRTEKQQEIVKRVGKNLSTVVGRMNNLAAKLREHVARVRARAQELAVNRGASITAIETALQAGEADISSAETKIGALQTSIASLNTTHPRDVAQTFRMGMQDIKKLFHSAQQHVVEAMKALRTAAKESRPTGTGSEKPSGVPTEAAE